MENNGDSKSIDTIRLKYNLIAIIAAFILLGMVFLYAITTATNANDITAVLSALTGIVGTIIGAYFGANVGAEGKQDAINTKDQAIEEKVIAVERQKQSSEQLKKVKKERDDLLRRINLLK